MNRRYSVFLGVFLFLFSVRAVATGVSPLCIAEVVGNSPLQKLTFTRPLRIETPHLELRTPTIADLTHLLPIFQDRLTVQHTWFAFEEGEKRWNARSLREQFEWQASQELKGDRHDFVIEHQQTGVLMGRAALYRPEKMGDWELGITLGRDFHGQGYGEEATRALINFAFERREAHDVVLEVLPENETMQALCKKLGLHLELSHLDAEPSGRFRLRYDYYAVEKSEWNAGK